MTTDRKTIGFLGITLDSLNTDEILERILEFVAIGRPHKVMYLNADCFVKAMKDREYCEILNKADMLYSDGISIVIGAKIFGFHLPGRSTAADFMPAFCRKFAERKYSIFLLGGGDGVAATAATRLKAMYPNILIAGTHHGYFRKEECQNVLNIIEAAKPHILLVGFGAPYQEIWIEKNFHQIDVPVVWGVGGLFDYLSGRLRRGPKILVDNGFEWLCRLCIEPKRLWRRYLIGNSEFIYYLLRQSLGAQVQEAKNKKQMSTLGK
ncbi:MAG: hypothetical protein A2X87_00905 [Deltaproteobacteria bacterium GWC2_42_51]|nr:MAG: hypothetical protein A2056_03920 [Deltaproteobacteria bacterium GWA2_42_85]OGP33044.1 MAG: hypothetical protein A2X87_00905 [Deltaproteobacteria bacterium GWC2_42_51]OGP42141.1 MAG: hypothetical protein A2090_02465 [Deltaproteobacteria bacterium GWD2_42_10]OGP48546.1 MAG: hypothetical protein A2022_08940 [Deltaproteobacteria bacterium GWF2_42_12]OGQ29351.1 MAG: hypothetical protein A3D29_03070 [Deltaproteobacteria bacterium RIFCSPHIGHO2_02_FULL_42_44]OGQ38751.1 MAG: hypothetical protei